ISGRVCWLTHLLALERKLSGSVSLKRLRCERRARKARAHCEAQMRVCGEKRSFHWKQGFLEPRRNAVDKTALDDIYNPSESSMRYPVEHKRQTRQRIVRAAARSFRSRGTEGATIGNLMRDLRLTHGGFYRHFDSKEELFTEAFGHSLEQLAGKV